MVYLHYTTVYCACLSVVLVVFVPVEAWPDGNVVGKELVILLFMCVYGHFYRTHHFIVFNKCTKFH